jgi:hypothetical protein
MTTTLLCTIGLHRPAWQPITTPDGWLQIRRCTRCQQPINHHQTQR